MTLEVVTDSDNRKRGRLVICLAGLVVTAAAGGAEAASDEFGLNARDLQIRSSPQLLRRADFKSRRAEIEDAARNGDPRANLLMAGAYANGIEVARSRDNALRFAAAAVTGGLSRGLGLQCSAWAASDLGPPDFTVARRLCAEGVAHGDTASLFSLGLMLLLGQGGPKDEARGLDLIREAAAGGHLYARYELARRAYSGDLVPKDPTWATSEMRALAEDDLPEAQSFLAVSYFQGANGLAVDVQRAMRLFRSAATNGVPEAQYNLGLVLESGVPGVAADRREAFDLFEKAADAGYPKALVKMARAYQLGGGDRPIDWGRSMALYKRAAEQGFGPGFTGVGLLYQNGQGVPQDYAKALEWHRRGLAAGDDAAARWVADNERRLAEAAARKVATAKAADLERRQRGAEIADLKGGQIPSRLLGATLSCEFDVLQFLPGSDLASREYGGWMVVSFSSPDLAHLRSSESLHPGTYRVQFVDGWLRLGYPATTRNALNMEVRWKSPPQVNARTLRFEAEYEMTLLGLPARKRLEGSCE
ncbi:tetratricopeptide repeat protein [Phenylobacterium sp.]|uniref:tetratricopeptide repeat protein n=1 Tax=Phenylobacterium sp. TaxID=1871053 RepID=UPI0025EEA3AA|nr:tetratricopeptide repeat protein [Phenylobacterium sp.]